MTPKASILDLVVGTQAITPNNDSFNFLKFTGKNLLHKQGYKGQNVIVAVIDTGVKADHPELAGKVLQGKNFAIMRTTDNPLDTTDRMGHGTHVSATIAGQLEKGCGIASMAKILPIKALDDTGVMWFTDWLFDALRFVISWRGANGERVDVVNMSLGGTGWTATEIATLKSLVQQLNNMGIPVIVSAGNTGTEKTDLYPAALEEVITVSSVSIDKVLSSFSTVGSNVDLCQIGQDVLSADISSNLYRYMSGTSMAAPMVTGIMALLICKDKILNGAYNSTLPGSALELCYYKALKNTSIDLGDKGTDKNYGAGFCTINQKLPVELKFAQGSNILYENGVAETMPAPCNVYKTPTMVNGVSQIPMRTFSDKADAIITYKSADDIRMLI